MGLKVYFKEPWKIILGLQNHGFGKLIPDEIFIKALYRDKIGRKLNLKNPVAFNEKLQWLKLYDRNPLYTTMVDKYAAKKYVADIIGEQYIIPTLGVWEKYNDIDFDALPDQFVLKCTHDSGGLIICKDKLKLDKEMVRRKIEASLKIDYYLLGREWPYKNVPHRIIAEKYMADSQTAELRDYKFYCFHGKPLYCQVISNRSTDEAIDFYDMEWVHQVFIGLNPGVKNLGKPIKCPKTFEIMKVAATKLSQGIPFVRADFYEVNGQMYFGELTFYPACGFGFFTPDAWNKRLGEHIQLI